MSATVYRTFNLQRFLQAYLPRTKIRAHQAHLPNHLQRTPSRALRLSSGPQAGRCDKTFPRPAADPKPGAAPLQRSPSRALRQDLLTTCSGPHAGRCASPADPEPGLRHSLPATCSGHHAGRCGSQAQPSSRQRPGPRALHPGPRAVQPGPPCPPSGPPCPPSGPLSPTSGPPCPFQAADLKLEHSGV